MMLNVIADAPPVKYRQYKTAGPIDVLFEMFDWALAQVAEMEWGRLA
jgi:hypothetical protein